MTIEECRQLMDDAEREIREITFMLRKTGSIPEWQKLHDRRAELEDQREVYVGYLDGLFASQADAQAADDEDRYQQDGQS